MMVEVVRARGLDRGFDRVARRVADRLDPAGCVAGLRAHADSRFTPPGAGPEAPLTDVVVHGADALVPSGRAAGVDPVALATTLEYLVGTPAKGFVAKGRTDGLVFEATDLDVRVGSGRVVVRGPALALCSVLCGRHALADQLSGEGLDTLLART